MSSPARAVRPRARPSLRCLSLVHKRRNRCEAARLVFFSGSVSTREFLFLFLFPREPAPMMPNRKKKNQPPKERLVTAHLCAWSSRPAPPTSERDLLFGKKRACCALVRQVPRGEKRGAEVQKMRNKQTKRKE